MFGATKRMIRQTLEKQITIHIDDLKMKEKLVVDSEEMKLKQEFLLL